MAEITQEEKRTIMRVMFSSYTDWEKAEALAYQKNWDKTKGQVQYTYQTVKHKKHYKKIKIIPIGLNNLCFQNSCSASRAGDYEIAIGHHITACPCGKRMSKEPHFCNKKTVNGKTYYYDFTKDFNGDKFRVFEETNPDSFGSEENAMKMVNNWLDVSNIKKLDHGCKCPITWKNRMKS